MDVTSGSYGGGDEAFATELHVGLIVRMVTAVSPLPHFALVACSEREV